MECETAKAQLEDNKSKLKREVETLKSDLSHLRERHERADLDHKREMSQAQTKQEEVLRETKLEVEKRVGKELAKEFEHRLSSSV